MEAHFRAFSFVDRITSIQDGKQIRGQYTIPSASQDFPAVLVGEAVGQLAAWAAMEASNFELRPVAGLAGSIELIREPSAGQILELAADVEQVDSESVQDKGAAYLGEQLLIRLEDCVGPMVPLADFDDPQLLRNRFDLLLHRGAGPGAFPGLPPLNLEYSGGTPGYSHSGVFEVPAAAPLFADHFPRRPVFPGSLLMHLNLQLGATLGRELPPPPRSERWAIAKIVDMKLRAFIPPGASLHLEAVLKHHSDQSARLLLKTSMANEIIASGGLMLQPTEAL